MVSSWPSTSVRCAAAILPGSEGKRTLHCLMASRAGRNLRRQLHLDLVQRQAVHSPSAFRWPNLQRMVSHRAFIRSHPARDASSSITRVMRFSSLRGAAEEPCRRAASGPSQEQFPAPSARPNTHLSPGAIILPLCRPAGLWQREGAVRKCEDGQTVN